MHNSCTSVKIYSLPLQNMAHYLCKLLTTASESYRVDSKLVSRWAGGSVGLLRENDKVANKGIINQGETPIFNIKAVVAQTGLNPATIRAWERRYGLPKPQRTRGGHRQYSQRDVDMLNWLIARQEEGMSISHAVELWNSELDMGRDPLQRTEMEGLVVSRLHIAG